MLELNKNIYFIELLKEFISNSSQVLTYMLLQTSPFLPGINELII